MDSLLSTLSAILIGLQIIVLVVDIIDPHRDNNKPAEKKREPTEEE